MSHVFPVHPDGKSTVKVEQSGERFIGLSTPHGQVGMGGGGTDGEHLFISDYNAKDSRFLDADAETITYKDKTGTSAVAWRDLLKPELGNEERVALKQTINAAVWEERWIKSCLYTQIWDIYSDVITGITKKEFVDYRGLLEYIDWDADPSGNTRYMETYPFEYYPDPYEDYFMSDIVRWNFINDMYNRSTAHHLLEGICEDWSAMNSQGTFVWDESIKYEFLVRGKIIDGAGQVFKAIWQVFYAHEDGTQSRVVALWKTNEQPPFSPTKNYYPMIAYALQHINSKCMYYAYGPYRRPTWLTNSAESLLISYRTFKFDYAIGWSDDKFNYGVAIIADCPATPNTNTRPCYAKVKATWSRRGDNYDFETTPDESVFTVNAEFDIYYTLGWQYYVKGVALDVTGTVYGYDIEKVIHEQESYNMQNFKLTYS